MTNELQESSGGRWRFWIDRGGTFTDVIGRAPGGRLHTTKVPSRSPAYAEAAVEGVRFLLHQPPAAGGVRPFRWIETLDRTRFPAGQVEVLRMGTTVATNALLERQGARTLFVTTAGLGDLLEIGDQARPDLFALAIRKPEPLHAGVLEAAERLSADGAVLTALDEPALAEGLARARAAGFESVAIALLHADLNPAHELEAGRLAEAAGFACVSLSHEVSPLPRVVPRARTTVLDAYLTPVLRAYVERMAAAVKGTPLWFMTSAGALVRADRFRGRDAVLSGPAGGVVGVARIAEAAGAAAVLGFDMGGTSTDVCRYAGRLERRDQSTAAGFAVRAPALDVETVAAGGGSILRFDGLRARVGPESAGADPGPAAYGRGGPATVTDANLVLGRLEPERFPALFGPAGDQPLDVAAARRALQALADAMEADTAEAAAAGFLAVAVEQTAQAVRKISVERGFDPRTHALVAFGGAAGQVACDVAEALGCTEVLCPAEASVLSAWGIGQARVSALRQAGVEVPLDAAGLSRASGLAERLAAEAAQALADQGETAADTRITLRLRYDGTDATLSVRMERSELDRDDSENGQVGRLKGEFETEHRKLFGFVEPARTVIIASVEVEAVSRAEHQGQGQPGAIDAHRLSATLDPNARSAPRGGLKIVHGPGQVTPPGSIVAEADALVGPVPGPALLIRGDTQIHVAAGWTAARDRSGLVRLTRAGDGGRAVAPDLTRVDPVTLELFNRRFMGVAKAMGAALERTAHSVNIKERLDFSCALFDREGGLVANAPHMPVHLGSMGASVRAVTDRHPTLRPGDAFALNNPYAGGTHLPDVTVVMPVFLAEQLEPPLPSLAGEVAAERPEGRLAGQQSPPGAPRPSLSQAWGLNERGAVPAFFVAARGHHADVGGVQPGSMPPFSRTIDEEGVLLDALPVMRDGVLLEPEVRAAFASGPHPGRNVDRNLADLKAQVAACQAGAGAVAAMITEHGRATVDAYMRFVQANAEASVRRAVARLTDGSARVPLDGGGEIVVCVSVNAGAGEATLDFTGTSGTLPSNFNAPSSVVDAAALYVFRTLVDDDIPLNAGCLHPLRIVLPRPSMLVPEPPAAVVAGNVETSQHLVDALYAATGTLANSQGSMNNFTFGDADRQYYETLCGGAGAGPDHDGASAVHTHMTNSRLTDPEILERRFPVRLERFAVRRGSGGEGARRGGDGVVRRLRFLAPMEAALLSTRRLHAPQGLAGGGPGSAGAQSLIRADGSVMDLPGCFSVSVQPGDAIEVETPGGGGFGAPPAAVA
jgi:5-oxoprolinase (ATP-hydrolysing)